MRNADAVWMPLFWHLNQKDDLQEAAFSVAAKLLPFLGSNPRPLLTND